MILENIVNGFKETKKNLKRAACISLATLVLAGGVKKAIAKTYYVYPYPGDNIQAVIDNVHVVDGDEVIVAEGRYYENINFKGKNITLRSIDPNNPHVVAKTIIDGNQNGSVVTFANYEDLNCVLDGFTIYHGSSYHGGGIRYRLSSATLSNCIVSYNSATGGGGGILIDGPSSPTLTNCIIKNNSAGWVGGGVYCDGSTPTFVNCVFIGNSSRFGGGAMHNWDCQRKAIELLNCQFIENTSGSTGGGIDNEDNTKMVLTNCTFVGNLAGIDGGGMYNYDSRSRFTNCILWGNAPDEIWTDENYASLLTVTCSNIQDGWPGVGNINTDPFFADPNNGDYHLKSQAGCWDPKIKSWVKDDVTSPCIDAGDPLSPIMYEPFPNGGIINMGAYGGTAEASKSYFGKPNCETIVAGDINGDCKVDFRDFAIMAYHWLETGE